MLVKANAKINVFLDVVKRREDGYHDLNMVMLPLELHDLITIEVLKNSTDSYVVCDHIASFDGKYNSITMMLNALRKRFSFKENFDISIHKEIPICAGLGGGSSNAAATMKAIISILKLKISPEEQIEIAKSVGADVPFCLINKPAHVEGIGEVVKPIQLKKKYHILIIKPDLGLSTKHVFEKCDSMELSHGDVNPVIEALQTGDDKLLSASLFNSLEPVSISMVPEIQEIKDRLKKDGFEMVLMTGSGSCVFGLTSDAHFASKMSKKYEKMGYDVYLTRTL